MRQTIYHGLDLGNGAVRLDLSSLIPHKGFQTGAETHNDKQDTVTVRKGMRPREGRQLWVGVKENLSGGLLVRGVMLLLHPRPQDHCHHRQEGFSDLTVHAERLL